MLTRALFKLTRKISTDASLDTVELFIDGKSVRVPPNTAIIQACKMVGSDIPRFCYHERLAIAGNCRMCLVQIEKMPKMVASCAQPVAAGMRVITNSPAVKKAREGVMEFLLANHPLDCPVCDQGGECDLQDQAMGFGSDRSRYRIDTQDKRAVEDKYLGPIVKTSMNRCIHCTRCVRFANEVAGVPELGTTGRGNDMQIGTYVEKTIKSELSGNIIDLCPVGALTSLPYAFKARPWELKKTESIDVMDGVGSAIRVDSRGMLVYRILPRENPDINEEWLADKSRYSCDSLNIQRLTKPLVRDKSSGMYKEAKWADALSLIASKISSCKPEHMQAIVGDFADAESLFSLRQLFESQGSSNLSLDSDNPGVDQSQTGLCHMNLLIKDFEVADAILIVGSNIRHEAPMLNLRIRKNYLNSDVRIGLVGPRIDLTYEYEHLGEDLEAISKFKDTLSRAKRPIIIVSQSALLRASKLLSKLFKQAKLTGDSLCVLNRTSSRSAALKLGYGLPILPESDFTYLLNADSDSIKDISSSFIVYQGHHGDIGALCADVILPGVAYTEKEALFMNIEGRLQSTRVAVPPPGDARVDWTIIRALSEFCDKKLPFDTLGEIREAVYNDLGCKLNEVCRSQSSILEDLQNLPAVKGKAFSYAINDYYMTDVISKLSPTMAACSRELG